MAEKEKSLNFILPLHIYPFDIMFSFNESDETLIKTLGEYGIDHKDHPWQFESDSTKGRTCIFYSGQTLVRLPMFPELCEEYGVLHHEIFHAVEYLFYRLNMKLSKGSGEAYAYLIGYITTEVYKKINEQA